MVLPLIGGLISAASSFLGGQSAQRSQEKMAAENIALQKQFAQEGIRWKVADAKAAGIHPLYALGANTTSFSPVSIGSPGGAGIAAAGQDIGRAVNAMRTPDEKHEAYENALRALQLRRGELENTLLASRIRVLNQPGTGPGLPGEKLQDPQRTRTIRTPEGLVVSQPDMSDAQAFEDRYGDIVQEIYGLRSWWREIGSQYNWDAHTRRNMNRLRDWGLR